MRIGEYVPAVFRLFRDHVAVIAREENLESGRAFILLYKTVRFPAVWNSMGAYSTHGPYLSVFAAAETVQKLVEDST